MNQAILHFIIPIIILRILSSFGMRLNKRLILLLSPIAVLPDLDFFIFYHRATFHNLFFGALIVIIAVLVLKKYFKPWKTAFIGGFYFLMHIALDNGSIIWFYPLTRTGYDFSGNKIVLESLQILPYFSLKFMILSSIGVLFLFSILVIEILIEKRIKSNKRSG